MGVKKESLNWGVTQSSVTVSREVCTDVKYERGLTIVVNPPFMNSNIYLKKINIPFEKNGLHKVHYMCTAFRLNGSQIYCFFGYMGHFGPKKFTI